MYTVDESLFGITGRVKGYNLIHKHQDKFNNSQEFDPLNNGWGIAYIFPVEYDPSYLYAEVDYTYRIDDFTSYRTESFNLTL